MMSIGHCTQRKPRICGNPCLVVLFVPKLLAQQIYLSFKMVDLNTEAPWGNGSKEWSDCKKTMVHVRHFSHRDPATVCSNSPPPPSSLVIETRASWGTFKYTGILLNITMVTWRGILVLHKFSIHETSWFYGICCCLLPHNDWQCLLLALKNRDIWCIL